MQSLCFLLHHDPFHYAQIKYIQYPILTEVAGFPVCKIRARNTKQPFLEQNHVQHITNAVRIHIAAHCGYAVAVSLP